MSKLMNPNFRIFIPARMESTRFPGKPLAPIKGVPMVIYIARTAMSTGYPTTVCTDSAEIHQICTFYSIDCLLTPPFQTGTDRIAWSSTQLISDFIINLQGDEPLITTEALLTFIEFVKNSTHISPIFNAVTYVGSQEAFDQNNVKCVLNTSSGRIIYFSRLPIRVFENTDCSMPFLKQLGLYCFSYEALQNFVSLPQSPLELTERVELLRMIENNIEIYSFDIKAKTLSVDTPADFVKVLEYLDILAND